MSREKQIEEMVYDIDAYIENVDVKHWYRDELDEGLAECLYNAGYRKHSEGMWKQAYNSYPRYVCTNCNHLFNNKEYKYCPNLGEIQQIAVENGIETKIVLNEKNVAEALKKQIPQKALYEKKSVKRH